MDLLLKCALAFKHLTNYQYTFTIGRKGNANEITLCFSDTDFHHLIRLHKLKDLHLARKNRQTVFREILSEKITMHTIQNSSYSHECLTRLSAFQDIEKFLDKTQKIFKYNSKRFPHSLLEGEYILVSEEDYMLAISFLFVDRFVDSAYFCRSFFPMEKIDYSKGQAQYTLLKKVKKNIESGTTEILYDRMK